MGADQVGQGQGHHANHALTGLNVRSNIAQSGASWGPAGVTGQSQGSGPLLSFSLSLR